MVGCWYQHLKPDLSGETLTGLTAGRWVEYAAMSTKGQVLPIALHALAARQDQKHHVLRRSSRFCIELVIVG